MVALEAFSDALAAIYATATTPDSWPTAIRAVNRAIGGNGGALLSATGQVWCIDDGVIPEEAATSYAEYYNRLDHTLAPVLSGPVGPVWTGDQLVAPYRNTEFYDGWLHRFDIEDVMFVRVTEGPAPLCFLVHAGRTSVPLGGADSQKAMSTLVPHLQQVLSMQRRLGELTDRNRDIVTALNAFTHGVIIVGADNTVVECNRAAQALITAGDGITVRASNFRLHDPGADRKLQHAMNAALGGAQAPPVGHTVACSRPSGKRPFIIQVMPLYEADPAADSAPHSKALITITDPEREPASHAASLFRHYGLTKAEIEIAERVARGCSPKQISEELCVSIDTVRTHLRHVFGKTDTHRQSELVRLLASMN